MQIQNIHIKHHIFYVFGFIDSQTFLVSSVKLYCKCEKGFSFCNKYLLCLNTRKYKHATKVNQIIIK